MAERAAAVRVEAKDGGFARFWGKAGDTVDAASKRMGKDLRSALSAGVEGGSKAVKDMFSSLKSGMSTLTGFASVGGVAALSKDAIDGIEVFEDLASAIEFGSHRLISFEALQKRAQAVAQRTGKDYHELGRAMQTVYGDTKDADYALDTVNAIGTASRATGGEVNTLARITGILNQKFGITSKEAPQALAAIIAGANAGGATLEDLADDFGEIGGKAKTLGLQGTKGVIEMLGVLNLAKQETGRFEQAMTALPQIFDQIIERGGKGGDLEKKLKIQTYGPDGRRRSPIAILQDIIRKTKGNETLLGELGFGGEGLQTILAMAKPFQAELKRTGGDIEAASEAFDRALDRSAGGALTWNDVQRRAAERMDRPAARFQQAVEVAKAAFADPQMLGALTELAHNAPPVAKAFAQLVQFVAKNPISSAGIATAGVFAKGASEAMLMRLLTGGGGGGGGRGAGNAVSTITGGGGGEGSRLASKVTAGVAALTAIAAAFEQYQELEKTLAGRSLGQGFTDARNDRERIDREIIRNAAAQGTEAFRPEKGFLGRDTGNILLLREERDADGQIRVKRTVASRRQQEHLGGMADRIAKQLEARIQGGGDKAQDKAPGGIAAMQRSLEQAVHAKELRVRVTNAAELRAAPTGTGPKPGNTPTR